MFHTQVAQASNTFKQRNRLDDMVAPLCGWQWECVEGGVREEGAGGRSRQASGPGQSIDVGQLCSTQFCPPPLSTSSSPPPQLPYMLQGGARRIARCLTTVSGVLHDNTVKQRGNPLAQSYSRWGNPPTLLAARRRARHDTLTTTITEPRAPLQHNKHIHPHLQS